MAIEFDTAPYRNSHLSGPRGRGSWAFGLSRDADACDREQVLWSPSMTYSEAKKWAREEIKRRFGPAASGTLYILP